MQHAESVVVSARCQQSTSALNQIAGPDKVIAAQVFVTLVETPGNGEAGDDSTEEVFGFVRAHDRHARPVQIFFPRLLVELLQCPLPVLPVSDVVFASRCIRSEQGREGLLTGFRPDSAKAECKDELAVAGGQVDFSGQRDVSVFRSVVLPRHLEILRQILPAIRDAGKTDGPSGQRRGARQRERTRVALGKEHRRSLVIAYPAGIAGSEVSQVRSQHGIDAVVAQISL